MVTCRNFDDLGNSPFPNRRSRWQEIHCFEKFALERKLSVTSIRSMVVEKGGPTREVVRSEEEVNLLYGTQSMEWGDTVVSGG